MTDNNAECEIRQRNGETKSEIEESKEEKEGKVEKVRTTWESVKYYYNRFRYYHFVVADTIDLYASAACLWLINMYFRLFMGVGSEPTSVLTEDD